MPVPDLRLLNRPLGPLRDKFAVTIGADDYELKTGFTCTIVTPATGGTLVYRTLEGSADQTETGLDAGDVIGTAGIPVALRIVRGSDEGTTVTAIEVGRP